MIASQFCPSSNSPSPCNENTNLSSPSNFFVIDAPMATLIPCPSEPLAILIPGKCSCVVGWPCNLLFSFLNVDNSCMGKYPHRASVLYQTGEICPLLKKNKSSFLPSILKSALYRKTLKYNAVK